jgi:hypothetical protein
VIAHISPFCLHPCTMAPLSSSPHA